MNININRPLRFDHSNASRSIKVKNVLDSSVDPLLSDSPPPIERWNQIGSDLIGQEENEYSGHSFAINHDGSIIAIGALSASGGGVNRGTVRVYKNINLTWVRLGSGDINGGELDADNFGQSVALNGDGTVLAVGAHNNDGSGTYSSVGCAKIYQHNSGSNTWDQIGDSIDGTGSYENAGWSVALNTTGDIVAVGSPGYSPPMSSYKGRVRIYQNSGGDWIQLGQDIYGVANGDKFGEEIGLSDDGTTIVIGSRYNDDSEYNAGHVRVFKYSNGSWNQEGEAITGEASSDSNGYSVAINSSGTIVAIGAPYNDGKENDAGHVRVYQRDASVAPLGWRQIGSDIEGDASKDYAGYSVSIDSSGSRVAIGAIGSDGASGSELQSGFLRIYDNINNSWELVGNSIYGFAGDVFGRRVAISRNGLVAGMTSKAGTNVTPNYAGTTRMYELGDQYVNYGRTIQISQSSVWAFSAYRDYGGVWESVGAVSQFSQGDTFTMINIIVHPNESSPGSGYYDSLYQVEKDNKYYFLRTNTNFNYV